MSFAEADFDALIDLIYEAPFDFGLWPEVLHRVSRAVNAKGGLLVPSSAPTSLLATSTRDLEDASEPYASHWWRYDRMTQEGARRRFVGEYTQFDVMDRGALARDPFFQEFRRDHDMGGMHGYVIRVEPATSIAIALQLGYGKDVLTADERTRGEILCRHIARAAKIAVKLAERISLRSGLAEAMQSLTIALAIVGPSQKVMFANRRFESLDRRGLRIVQGRIVTEQAAQQPVFDRIVAEAIGRPAVPKRSNSLALHRSSGRPQLVQVIPLSGSEERGFAGLVGRRRALVVATDPDESLPSGDAALLALGLTAAEARVARLIGGGLSPAEAAGELGNAEATVRALLKRVYFKIGADRQAQLAKLVARLTIAE